MRNFRAKAIEVMTSHAIKFEERGKKIAFPHSQINNDFDSMVEDCVDDVLYALGQHNNSALREAEDIFNRRLTELKESMQDEIECYLAEIARLNKELKEDRNSIKRDSAIQTLETNLKKAQKRIKVLIKLNNLLMELVGDID